MLGNLHRSSAPESKSLADLLKSLEESAVFGFTVHKQLREPFRHTCIELQFDRRARFTISRRIRDKTFLPAAIFGTRAVSYIEQLTGVKSENCGTIFQSTDKEESKAMLAKLLLDSEATYNLWDKNCREQLTATVLSAMDGKTWEFASKRQYLDFVQHARVEDRRRVTAIFMLYFGLVIHLSTSVSIIFLIAISLILTLHKNSRNIAALLASPVISYAI